MKRSLLEILIALALLAAEQSLSRLLPASWPGWATWFVLALSVGFVFFGIWGLVYGADSSPVKVMTSGNMISIGVPRNKIAFTSEMGKEIARNAPREKPVRLSVVGVSARDRRVGQDVFDFLSKSGYKIVRESIGLLIPVPEDPFTVVSHGEETRVIVYAAAL